MSVSAAPTTGAEAEAPTGDSSAPESAPSPDDAADGEPAETAAEAPPAEEAPATEEDISLEAILEDLKRREGRSE